MFFSGGKIILNQNLNRLSPKSAGHERKSRISLSVQDNSDSQALTVPNNQMKRECSMPLLCSLIFLPPMAH